MTFPMPWNRPVQKFTISSIVRPRWCVRWFVSSFFPPSTVSGLAANRMSPSGGRLQVRALSANTMLHVRPMRSFFRGLHLDCLWHFVTNSRGWFHRHNWKRCYRGCTAWAPTGCKHNKYVRCRLYEKSILSFWFVVFAIFSQCRMWMRKSPAERFFVSEVSSGVTSRWWS